MIYKSKLKIQEKLKLKVRYNIES